MNTHMVDMENGVVMGDHFLKDEEVEVCLDEEGFMGSWYSATVIRTLKISTIKKNLSLSSISGSGSGPSTGPDSRFRKIYLQFYTLNSDADNNKPHRQYVDFLLVRPAPPREPNRSFSVNEEVDAFHHDGWWEGFIIDIIPPSRSGDPTSYSVYFRGSREMLVFPQNDIRLHREWVHGKWVPSLESKSPQQQQHSASSSHSVIFDSSISSLSGSVGI